MPGIVGGLATACLCRGHIHHTTGIFQKLDCRKADRRPEQVNEAGHEETDIDGFIVALVFDGFLPSIRPEMAAWLCLPYAPPVSDCDISGTHRSENAKRPAMMAAR